MSTLDTFELGEHPYIVIECPGSDSEFDITVKAGGGVESQDELVAVLLLLVEKVTGVPADLYTHEIDIVRQAAGLRALRPTSEPDAAEPSDV